MREQDGNVEDRYRHVRHHPVFGKGPDGEVAGPGRTSGRAGAGPRRARPGIAPVPSRPSQPRRPAAPGSVVGVPVVGVPVAGVPGLGPVRPEGLDVRPAGSAGDRAVRMHLARVPSGPPEPAAGPRVLPRRTETSAPGRARILVRRWVAGAAVIVVAALAVVALGLLADAVSAARHPVAPVPSTPAAVTVEVPGTVWDVAGHLEPGASPAERAALVGRIVTANSLTSAEVRPGQVLAVPSR